MRALVLLLTALAVFAQPSNGRLAGELSRIELRVLDPHPFTQGELIQIEIKTARAAATQPTAAITWGFAGFLVDPATTCGTADKPCRDTGGGGGGFSRPEIYFEQGRDTSVATLNHYLPDLPPGRYQVSAQAAKSVRLNNNTSFGVVYGAPNPPEYMVSNAVELVIQPASRQWIDQTLATSATTLVSSSDEAKLRAAAQQLGLLDVPESWATLLDVLPVQEEVLFRELSSHTKQKQALCDLMRSRIGAPQQVVSSLYIDTLVGFCTSAALPPFPATPAVASVRVSPTPYTAAARTTSTEQQAYFDKQRSLDTEFRSNATAALAASLEQKQPLAQRTALFALLQHVGQVQRNLPRMDPPAWSASLAPAFAKVIPSLDAFQRRNLFSLFSGSLRTSDLAPVFEAVLKTWKPGGNSEEFSQALYALYRSDPKRAQAAVLAEFSKEATWLQLPLLDVLNGVTVPNLDEALLTGPASKWPAEIRDAAIVKFVSAEALPQVRALHQSRRIPCASELVAYFLRHDPAYALGILNAPTERYCKAQYFQRTPLLAMNDTLEQWMIPQLMNAEVVFKTEAAKALGRYGSAKAREPLLAAYRYFHEYWNGKAAELEKNGEGLFLEMELRRALGRGTAWFSSEADLKMLENLCISERCRFDAAEDVRRWAGPIYLDVGDDKAGIRGSVAQYFAFETMDELAAKLRQLPRGTVLTTNVHGPDRAMLLARLKQEASTAGLILQEP